MRAKTKFIPVEEFLVDSLRDPEEALCYLVVAYEEFVKDNDLASFLLSLRFIAAAKDGTLKLEKGSEVDVECLHRLFSKNPNLQWEEAIQALDYAFCPLDLETIDLKEVL